MNNYIVPPVVSMSSREIAQLTGKQHKNVIRDARKMLDELEIDRLKFERIYLDSYGREKTELHLDQELTVTLISGYSAKLRYAIVKRWQSLEIEQTKWMVERERGQRDRKRMTDSMKDAGSKPYEYPTETNRIYKIIFGMTSKQLRASRGLTAKQNTRDSMTNTEISDIDELEVANAILISAKLGAVDRQTALTEQFLKLQAKRRLSISAND